MDSKNSRIIREAKTIEAMIEIYCHDHHGRSRSGLCTECGQFLDYAEQRLSKCPFQEGKTTCANCPVHCYRPKMRQKVKVVMRYSGPRMTYLHPILALYHFIDGFRKKPIRTVHRRAKAHEPGSP